MANQNISIDRVKVGEAAYRFRRILLGAFHPHTHGEMGEWIVIPSVGGIVGHGQSLDDARRDWESRLHARFQTLLAKRPWEMDDAEKIEWEQLEGVIDVAAHRRETPYRIRQVGIIQQRRPTEGSRTSLPNLVRWESGRKEKIRLDRAPPEFARLHAGKRFEAVVLRDSVTDRLIKILDVVPLGAPPSREDCDRLWHSSPAG